MDKDPPNNKVNIEKKLPVDAVASWNMLPGKCIFEHVCYRPLSGSYQEQCNVIPWHIDNAELSTERER